MEEDNLAQERKKKKKNEAKNETHKGGRGSKTRLRVHNYQGSMASFGGKREGNRTQSKAERVLFPER